jgi:hypothetical protein
MEAVSGDGDCLTVDQGREGIRNIQTGFVSKQEYGNRGRPVLPNCFTRSS